MSNGIVVITPSKCVNITEPGNDVHGNIMQYVQNGALSMPPSQTPQNRALAKCLKVETLGAIQIIIGLTHISFGALPMPFVRSYIPYNNARGYPFWSGIFFIASGWASVAAGKHGNASLIKCSVGMNITSAIMALSGILLSIAVLALNLTVPYYISYRYSDQDSREQNLDVAFAVLFLLFNSMEFCITVMVAHFGCRENCCTSDIAIAYLPCAVTGDNPDAAVYENTPGTTQSEV